ncbi:MAG: tetratricopeptide repeat protein [Myxococcota bacterium]
MFPSIRLGVLRAGLAWQLTCGALTCAFVFAGPAVEDAEAKKRKKKKRRRGRKEPAKKIKKEQGLSERQDAEFIESVSKTKDRKEELAKEETGPTLDIQQLDDSKAEDLAESKLNEEIQLVEQLLRFETECGEASPARFRLADLYWEKSKRYFFKSNDFNTSEGTRAKYDVAMKKFQNATTNSYKKILETCPTYEETPKILFYLGKAMVELDRAEEGAAYYKEIIQNYPDSEWVANAWFGVGEYYFNNANDANKALRAYKRAAGYTNSQVYGFAVYKQGWCYVNTGDWDLALERFREVVAISNDPQRRMDSKGRISLRKEGLKDYVRAYAQVGDPKRARPTFLKIGGKRDLAMMMERLGNWYVSQGEHRGVITIYRDLIKTFPKSSRLPVFQGNIVDASSRLGDKKATVAQAKVLTDYFDQVRKRVAKGEFPDDKMEQVSKDLGEAEEIAENTLRRLAMEYHKDAKKLRGSTQDRTFRLAHDLYSHYLTVFPEPIAGADVNYVFYMRFYYAEVLYKLEKFKESALNYDRVVAMMPKPAEETDIKIVLSAAEESVRSWDELVTDMDRLNPPEISGTEKKKIPQVKLQLIEACRRYTDYVNTPKYKSYVEASVDDIVGIGYKMARIYYTYNHFDKAAPAFNRIVKYNPDHEVACYAANLALDIYNGEKNYRAMVKATGEYLKNAKLACGDEDRQKFAGIQEKSTFQLVKQEYEDKKKYILAARAYKQFEQKFKKSELADDAVYNAAVNYDLAGRLNQANDMREYLVKFYPDSDLVPETLYNIAQSYERVVDFRSAARYYEVFVERYPDDKRSKDALYNAGLYRDTLGEYSKSREDRSTYIEKYAKGDAHDVAYAVCESMEKQARSMERKAGRLDKGATKAWTDAHDCYFDFIKNRSYTAAAPDLLCEAQFRRGEIMREKTKYQRGYTDQVKYLMDNWPKWKGRIGLKKLPRCAEAVAELKFRNLEPATAKYKKMGIAELNPTDRGVKKFQGSVQAKLKEQKRLSTRYQEVVETGVAKWGFAALFRIGELHNDMANQLLDARIPNKIGGVDLGEDIKEQLRTKLRGEAQPAINEAVTAFELCVSRSNELGEYSQWSVKSLRRLQKLAPEQYQPLDERLVKVDYPEPLEVVSSGVVIKDGDGYKQVQATTDGGVVPNADSEEKDAAEKEEPTVTEAEAAPAKAATKPTASR